MIGLGSWPSRTSWRHRTDPANAPATSTAGASVAHIIPGKETRMQFETLLYEVVEGVAIIRLNRPDRMNTLGGTMKPDLARAFFELARDDTSVRCVVLTGTGDRAFCAGADIKERAGGTAHPADYYVTQQRTHELFRGIEEFEKPVIAAINGVALGGGLELALCADIRLAAKSARFGLPEIKLGVIPQLAARSACRAWWVRPSPRN
jgi:enoyl-CoA hydratase